MGQALPSGGGGLSRDYASGPRPLHPSLYLHTHLSDACTPICIHTHTSLIPAPQSVSAGHFPELQSPLSEDKQTALPWMALPQALPHTAASGWPSGRGQRLARMGCTGPAAGTTVSTLTASTQGICLPPASCGPGSLWAASQAAGQAAGQPLPDTVPRGGIQPLCDQARPGFPGPHSAWAYTGLVHPSLLCTDPSPRGHSWPAE